MLTEGQKKRLEKKIYNLIKESIFENGYYENYFGEGGKTKHIEDEPKNRKRRTKDDDSAKRDSVLRWLDSEQELHSVLAYELWPEKDEDTARSLFSKKYRGEDNHGKSYEFDPGEINRLYNLRGDFITDAGLD